MSEAEKSEAELVYEHKKKEKEAEDEKKFTESHRQLRLEIAQQEEEIRILKAKQEARKKKREEEQAQMEEKRRQEEIRRREEEAAKRRQKEEAEKRLREEKLRRNVELQKQMTPDKKRNFVVPKSAPPAVSVNKTAANEAADAAKTKLQLEQQKQAVLHERITPLVIAGLDAGQLADKAKELHDKLYRLESEKYDLEDTVKRQQYDLMELAERSRQMNKAGNKSDGKGADKLLANQRTTNDPIIAKYSQVPPKISICSKYERRKDLRDFGTRKSLFEGKKAEQNAVAKKAEA